MEKTIPMLDSAGEIFFAFNTVAKEAEGNASPETDKLLLGLAQLFILRPDKELIGCVAGSAEEVNNILTRIFNSFEEGTPQRKAVMEKGFSLVDSFANAGNLSAADAWLQRAEKLYTDGSEYRKAVVAKRLSITDTLVNAGKLDAADAWLWSAYYLCTDGSKERKC